MLKRINDKNIRQNKTVVELLKSQRKVFQMDKERYKVMNPKYLRTFEKSLKKNKEKVM